MSQELEKILVKIRREEKAAKAAAEERKGRHRARLARERQMTGGWYTAERGPQAL